MRQWRQLPAALFLAAGLTAQTQTGLNQLYQEAQQAQSSGDLITATRRYEAIIRLRPNMAEAYANLGNLYYQQGMTVPAKTAYEKALAQKPDLNGPHFFLGVIAFGERQYPAALAHLEKAAAAQPANPLIYAYLGYTRFARSEYLLATLNLEKANVLNAADADVLYHLSKCYGHLADQAYGQLQRAASDSAYVALARAHLAETKEDWKEAAQEYSLALRTMPDDKRLNEKALSSAALAAGKAAPSVSGATDEIVDASLAYKETPPAGDKLYGEIARWRRTVSEGVEASLTPRQRYLRAEGYQILSYLTSLAVLRIDQDSFRAHQLRAQIFEGANNDEEAIREYQEASKRKPDLQNIHFAIGTLEWKDHRLEDAQKELQLEIEINPNHPEAMYELGDIAAFSGRTEEAERYFLEAARLNPGMVEAHYALEKIYTESGRFENSLAQLQAVLTTNALEATAHYRLAVVYRKLGRLKEAEKELALFDQSKARSASNYSGSPTVK